MPCYVTGSELGDANLSRKEAQAEATKLARLLCEACRLLDESKPNGFARPSAKLKKWCKEHKAIDQKRTTGKVKKSKPIIVGYWVFACTAQGDLLKIGRGGDCKFPHKNLTSAVAYATHLLENAPEDRYYIATVWSNGQIRTEEFDQSSLEA